MRFITLTVFFLIISGITQAGPLMYVPTGDANDIVIIDLKTDEIVGRIDELENAHGLSGSPNTEYLVAGSMQPMESGVNTVGSKPEAVSDDEHASHHVGEEAIAVKGGSFLSIVHPKHGHVMRRIEVDGLTHHTVISPDGKIAVAVHSGLGGISVVDLDQSKVLRFIKTGMWPNYAVFKGDGSRLYVSNAQPGTISEIQSSDWTVIRTIPVGKSPEHMVLSKDNSTLFVANVGAAEIALVDLFFGGVVKTFPVGMQPHGIDLAPDQRLLFVASKDSNQLSRIDLLSGVSTTLDLNPAPYHLDYVDEVNKIYVSSRKEPKIWVIDPQALLVTKEISIGKGIAHQMVTITHEK